jgi:hypothetical protein
MRVHLINPSDVSFGTAVITPRWLYVIAAATPGTFGDPSLVDETLLLSTHRAFSLAMLWASAFTQRMLCAAIRLGQLHALVARTWCSEEFTQPSIRTKRKSLAAHMPS